MRSFLLVCGMVTFTAAPSFAGPLEVLDADTEAGTRTITLVLDGARSLNPASYVLRVDGDVDGVMARYVEPFGRDTPHATTLVIEDRGDVPELLERVAPMVTRPSGSTHVRARLRLVTYGARDVVECDLLVLADEPRVQRHDCRTHAAGRGALDAIGIAIGELATAPLPDRALLVIGTSGTDPIDGRLVHELWQQAYKAEISTRAIVYRAPRPDRLPSVIPMTSYAETLDDVAHHAYRIGAGTHEQSVRVTFPTFEASTGYAMPWDGERRAYRVSTFDAGEATTRITLPDLRAPDPAWPLPVALGAGLGGLALGFLAGRRRAAARVARLGI